MALSSDVTKTIVSRVAEYEQCPPEKLPALEEKIDSDTYRQLMSCEDPLHGPLEFEYLWYQVTVEPDGEVTVRP